VNTPIKSGMPPCAHSASTCHDGVCTLTGTPAIAAESVNISYRGRLALSNANFNATQCSITALIGPSGCGKTSLLQCFNRLTDLNEDCQVSGSVRIAGQSIINGQTDIQLLRRQVGMIFQKPNPFPLSIWKNIALPLQFHGMRTKSDLAATVQSVLNDVGLWDEVKDRLHHSAMALSGGQQQRLCIARAIALQPEILLMDEPCSALDPLASGRIEELIVSLRNRFTVVIVTHNLAQARRISDSTGVFWVKDGVGQLIEQGPTEQIFLAPSNPHTAAYISGQRG
jgi:phosphate transport system ATP-binding protein